ncbi:hypothetical protein F5Y09DRAFT_338968 [Xylaria sp. FL1042]|nr:hypothetical protein F5Y09DRAFT_338968 [Xylaria sp. FL1042]
MAQQRRRGPGPRALLLNNYFADEHAFHPEKYVHGNIIYKRVTLQYDIERIVVKHVSFEWGLPRDQEIDSEEDILRRLWGSEHNLRLLSVVDDQHHRGSKWAEPKKRARQNPPAILPWKLRFNPDDYADPDRNLAFSFLVTEYLSRGEGGDLLERCKALGMTHIPESVLWYFFLCVTRGCIGIAFPPNVGTRNPAAIVRERFPPRGKRKHSKITHWDLHLGNIMFGDYDVRNIQPPCHEATPIIDFGNADTTQSVQDSQYQNIFQAAELIHQLACLEEEYDDIDDREKTMVHFVPGFPDFLSYVRQDFIDNDEHYSQEFRGLVSVCMAVRPVDRLLLEPLLRRCEAHVRQIGNWRDLADEVTRMFDEVPAEDDDAENNGARDNDVEDDDPEDEEDWP